MADKVKVNWLELLLDGIPVAMEVAPDVRAALRDGKLSFSEVQEIGTKVALALAERKGIKLVMGDRFTSNIPTDPGFYWVRGENQTTVAQRLEDGGFMVVGRGDAVSEHFFDGAEFAPVV